MSDPVAYCTVLKLPSWACCLLYVAATSLPPRLPSAVGENCKTPHSSTAAANMAGAATQNTPLALPDTVCKNLLALEAHLHSLSRVLRA